MLKTRTDIIGSIGPDVLIGSPRADQIDGGAGNDRLYGLGGDDLIHGGVGNDSLFGGSGNDRLHGNRGDDTLTGGDGNDRFVFDLRGGNDNVTDYTVGEDRLDFRNFDLASVDEALSHAAQNDADVVFTFDSGETVTVQNVDLSTLGAGDFVI